MQRTCGSERDAQVFAQLDASEGLYTMRPLELVLQVRGLGEFGPTYLLTYKRIGN